MTAHTGKEDTVKQIGGTRYSPRLRSREPRHRECHIGGGGWRRCRHSECRHGAAGGTLAKLQASHKVYIHRVASPAIRQPSLPPFQQLPRAVPWLSIQHHRSNSTIYGSGGHQSSSCPVRRSAFGDWRPQTGHIWNRGVFTKIKNHSFSHTL